MSKFFIISPIMCLFLLSGCKLGTVDENVSESSVRSTDRVRVQIDGDVRVMELANDPIEQAQGLSGRKNIDRSSGMLFVFQNQRRASFWMKDMHFAIDIIWIRDGVIIGYEDNVPPEPGVATKDLQTYLSPKPIDWVIEVAAGVREQQGWEIGDGVEVLDDEF